MSRQTAQHLQQGDFCACCCRCHGTQCSAASMVKGARMQEHGLKPSSACQGTMMDGKQRAERSHSIAGLHLCTACCAASCTMVIIPLEIAASRMQEYGNVCPAGALFAQSVACSLQCKAMHPELRHDRLTISLRRPEQACVLTRMAAAWQPPSAGLAPDLAKTQA